MRNFHYLLFLFLAIGCQQHPNASQIRYNQLGYYPNSAKKIVVTNTTETQFEIRSVNNTIAYSGELSTAKNWDKSGEEIKIADFTVLTLPGIYYFYINDSLQTQPFKITKKLYRNAFKASLKSYYYARASTNIEEEYAGKWHRKLGHIDTLCKYYTKIQTTKDTITASKGWYDAGDYNKYVVNAGVTVGTLLNFQEAYPKAVLDDYSNIPESNNGISDLLDEVRYELDWIVSMQAPDGGVHMKLTSKNFTDFAMPETDTTERYIMQKSTAATLNFAAMIAQAGRLFSGVDSVFSKECITASQKAWAWAVKNPKIVYKNPSDVVTGEYPDSVFVEEFWWAASELFLATGKEEFTNYITTNTPYLKMDVGESWRKYLGNIGSYSLLLTDSVLDNTIKRQLKSQLLIVANDLVDKIDSIPYRIPVNNFHWGSNSDILNSAIILSYAYRFSNDKKYLNAVVETTDYIFGKNATGYSFMTGFGIKTALKPHNRYIGADGIDEPIPGFIIGGPNQDRPDDISKVTWGVAYSTTLPANSYVDKQGSYASNETAINWNAPAVFVLGFLEANADQL